MLLIFKCNRKWILTSVSVGVIMFAVGGQTAIAEGPLQRLRQRFDSVRPGWIIPLPEEDSSSKSPQSKPTSKKSKDSASSKKKSASDKSAETPKSAQPKSKRQGTPTPAQPRPFQPESLKAAQVIAPAANRKQTPITPPEEPDFPSAPSDFGATLEALDDEGGLKITEIDPKGAAAAAELQVGDVVREVGGVKLATVESLGSITESLDNGVVVDFKIIRQGKKLVEEVQFGTYRETPVAADPSQSDARSAVDAPVQAKPAASASTELLDLVAPTGNSVTNASLRSVLSNSEEAVTNPAASVDTSFVGPGQVLLQQKATSFEESSLDELLDLEGE